MAARSFTFVFLVLFLAFLRFPSAQSKPIQYCDRKGNYDVKIKEVEMSPDPVIRGEPATFNLYATSDTAVSGGKLEIDVSYLSIHIHSETHDLCEETKCPISTGDFVLSHSQNLPSFTPPGLYTLRMKLMDLGGQQLTCISFSFRIKVGSSVADG